MDGIKWDEWYTMRMTGSNDDKCYTEITMNRMKQDLAIKDENACHQMEMNGTI